MLEQPFYQVCRRRFLATGDETRRPAHGRFLFRVLGGFARIPDSSQSSMGIADRQYIKRTLTPIPDP